jgi:hypothetical protein
MLGRYDTPDYCEVQAPELDHLQASSVDVIRQHVLGEEGMEESGPGLGPIAFQGTFNRIGTSLCAERMSCGSSSGTTPHALCRKTHNDSIEGTLEGDGSGSALYHPLPTYDVLADHVRAARL